MRMQDRGCGVQGITEQGRQGLKQWSDRMGTSSCIPSCILLPRLSLRQLLRRRLLCAFLRRLLCRAWRACFARSVAWWAAFSRLPFSARFGGRRLLGRGAFFLASAAARFASAAVGAAGFGGAGGGSGGLVGRFGSRSLQPDRFPAATCGRLGRTDCGRPPRPAGAAASRPRRLCSCCTARSSPGTTLLANSSSEMTPTVCSAISAPRLSGIEWPPSAHLRDVGDDERRGAVVLLQMLGRLADVLLLERFEVELVDRFEHAVERLLEPRGRLGRVHQRLERIGQLANRAHADFVPAEVVLLERVENLLGRLRAANPPAGTRTPGARTASDPSAAATGL